jgi:deuterolysin
MATDLLDEDAFETLPAGEAVEVTFDVAETHDLQAGGAFDIVSSGAISYAEAGSTSLAGAIPFTSNRISASVDGKAANSVRMAFHRRAKRQILQADCTGVRANQTTAAIANCAMMAGKAQTAAATGPAAKLEEYFRSSTNATRTTVETVFRKIVAECGAPSAGVSRYYCTDVYQSCLNGVLAYTMPSRSFMVNCPLYFRALPALSPQCHAQDQSGTTLHETTHLTQIKGTEDYGVYGYRGIRQLSSRQALNHADSYALFANGESPGGCEERSHALILTA